MATIGKTFNDPEKFEQRWYLQLPKDLKHLYLYCWERSDHAGVIEFNPMWEVHTGIKVTQEMIDEMITICNQKKKRIVKLEDDKMWFTEYIRLNQQSDLTQGLRLNYSFHKHVFNRILHHGLFHLIHERDPLLLREYWGCLPDDLRLTEGLAKDTGKELGRGSGSGSGKEAPYYQSKEIAERLTPENGESVQQITSQVNEFARSMKDEQGIEKPHQLLLHTIAELENTFTKTELTFSFFKEQVSDLYAIDQ